MINLANKKLQFLSGSQSRINSMQQSGGAQEGAFYLTDDTHRLYIGVQDSGGYIQITASNVAEIMQSNYIIYRRETNANNTVTYIPLTDSESATIDVGTGTYYAANPAHCKPVAVNAGIEEVNSIQDLPIRPSDVGRQSGEDEPTEGAPTFYYVRTGNILCIYGEISPADPANNISATYGWIQINSDTFINNITVEDSGDGAYATIVYEQNNNNDSAQDLYLNIAAKDTAPIKITINDDDDPTVELDVQELTLKGVDVANSNNSTLQLNGIYHDENAVSTTISGVTLAAGSLMAAIDSNNNGDTITFSPKSQAIDSITTEHDNNGTSLIIEQDNRSDTTDSSNQARDNSVSIVLPAIYYGADPLTPSVYNLGEGGDDFGGNNLSVYTIDEINAKLTQLQAETLSTGNAMVYKGIIAYTDSINQGQNAGHNFVDTINEPIVLTENIRGGKYVVVSPSQVSDNGTIYYQQSADGQFVAVAFSNLDNTKPIYKEAINKVGDTYRIATLIDLSVNSDGYVFGDLTAEQQATLIGRINNLSILQDKEYKLYPGDLIIANSTGSWDIIPAGDEPSYTLLTEDASVANSINGVDVILQDANGKSTGEMTLYTDFDNSINVEKVEDSNDANVNLIKINHKAVHTTGFGLTQDTYFNTLYDSTEAPNGKKYNDGVNDYFKEINVITTLPVDKFGHVEHTNFATVTFRQNYIASTVYDGITGGAGIILTDQIGNMTELNFVTDDQTTSLKTSFVADDTNHKIKLETQLVWGSF